jgi:hypothetical protein
MWWVNSWLLGKLNRASLHPLTLLREERTWETSLANMNAREKRARDRWPMCRYQILQTSLDLLDTDTLFSSVSMSTHKSWSWRPSYLSSIVYIDLRTKQLRTPNGVRAQQRRRLWLLATFSLKVRVENPRDRQPWCSNGRKVVVSYSGVALAWGRRARFLRAEEGGEGSDAAATGEGSWVVRGFAPTPHFSTLFAW